MSEQPLPFTKGQSLPCHLENGALRRCITSWLLDGKLRQLSSETLTNRKLICDKLIWFLDQKELPSCGVAELKAFFGYVRSGHEEEGGRWGNEANDSNVRPATAHMYYSRVRTLFAYAVDEGLLDVSPFASMKPPVVKENQILPFTPPR